MFGKRHHKKFYLHHYAKGHGVTTRSHGHHEENTNYIKSVPKPEILVIGSGSGLIPMYFSEFITRNPGGSVTLIDAGFAAAGFGHPWGDEGWGSSASDLYRYFPQVRILYTTSELGINFCKANNLEYDLIFIDANHSEEYVFLDLLNSSMIIRSTGALVLHDGNLESVYSAVKKFLSGQDQFYMETKLDIGAGAIVIKRRVS